MKRSNFERKVSIFLAFVVATFYFFIIQIAVETLIVMGIDFTKSNMLLWVPVLLFAAVWFAIVFFFYFLARLLEEGVKARKSRIVMFLFYYALPIGFYLTIRREINVELSITVVILAVLIRQCMEWLFLKFWKKKFKT